MAKPVLRISETESFRLVEVEIPGGVCTPAEAAEAVEETANKLPGQKAILLNGRMPIWLAGMLVHASHAAPAVATFDPRMEGYVVVASHTNKYGLGDVIAGPTEG